MLSKLFIFMKVLQQKILASPYKEVTTLYHEEIAWLAQCAFLYVNHAISLETQLNRPLLGDAGFWAMEHLVGAFIIRVFYINYQKIPMEVLTLLWTFSYSVFRLYTVFPYIYISFFNQSHLLLQQKVM